MAKSEGNRFRLISFHTGHPWWNETEAFFITNEPDHTYENRFVPLPSPPWNESGVSAPPSARWLNGYEIALCIGLLLIPYVTRSHEMCMGSMGRFAAVVFPLYLVLGRLLAKLPIPLAAALLGVSGLLMATYAALFAAWYRIF